MELLYLEKYFFIVVSAVFGALSYITIQIVDGYDKTSNKQLDIISEQSRLQQQLKRNN